MKPLVVCVVFQYNQAISCHQYSLSLTRAFTILVIFPTHYVYHPPLPLLRTTEFDEFLAERMRILADAAALKHLAKAFLHPELPVITTDPTACGPLLLRSLLGPRPSIVRRGRGAGSHSGGCQGPQGACRDVRSSRDWSHVPTDLARLRQVTSTVTRAPEQESRTRNPRSRLKSLPTAKALKDRAVMYVHPEIGVITDAIPGPLLL